MFGVVLWSGFRAFLRDALVVFSCFRLFLSEFAGWVLNGVVGVVGGCFRLVWFVWVLCDFLPGSVLCVCGGV